MNVKAQPTPTSSIKSCKNAIVIAAMVQRTTLLEAWAAAGVPRFLSTSSVLYTFEHSALETNGGIGLGVSHAEVHLHAKACYELDR